MINPNDFAPLLTRQSNKVRAQQPTGSSNKNHSDFFPRSPIALNSARRGGAHSVRRSKNLPQPSRGCRLPAIRCNVMPHLILQQNLWNLLDLTRMLQTNPDS